MGLELSGVNTIIAIFLLLLYCIVLCFIVLHCIVLYCVLLYCIVLYFIVLHSLAEVLLQAKDPLCKTWRACMCPPQLFLFFSC